jgi:hypothetical protein
MRELGPQHLERDLAVVPHIMREVDRGHAALAKLALDAVAISQGGAESVRCHGFPGCRGY